MAFLLVFLILCSILEFYSYQAIRNILPNNWILNCYKIISFLTMFYILYRFTKFDRSQGQTRQDMYTVGFFVLVYLPKFILTLAMFGEDIFRFFYGAYNNFYPKEEGQTFLASRRKFVSQIGLGLAAVPFLSLLYGITIGKYNYKVVNQTLFYPDLPDSFDGFKITQISDVHSGSFDNPEKISYAIDLVNEQEADMILFTGDIVNTFAKEMHPWIDTFKRIKNYEYGKYSVLGNHDYGEYVDWNSASAKEKNFQDIKNLYSEIDFKLLLNENVKIKKDGHEIALVGVENWGYKFKQAGDLNKAAENLKKEDFKILMSHDPSHWEMEVKNHPKHFHLTLSGHTHGFQFGIEIPGFLKWSPVEYLYKQWAGLYENVGRYIYVNRGFGFHAFPGRVGIMPEITVITLKKGNFVS